MECSCSSTWASNVTATETCRPVKVLYNVDKEWIEGAVHQGLFEGINHENDFTDEILLSYLKEKSEEKSKNINSSDLIA